MSGLRENRDRIGDIGTEIDCVRIERGAQSGARADTGYPRNTHGLVDLLVSAPPPATRASVGRNIERHHEHAGGVFRMKVAGLRVGRNAFKPVGRIACTVWRQLGLPRARRQVASSRYPSHKKSTGVPKSVPDSQR
jgi:hypothetical protein